MRKKSKSREAVERAVNAALARGEKPVVEIPAPHVVAEREALAQLGARVLEILVAGWSPLCKAEMIDKVEDAARSLGLLPEAKP